MIRTLLRGLALLRSAELVDELVRLRIQLREIGGIRAAYPDCRLSSHALLVNYAAGRFALGPQATVSPGCVLAFGDEVNGFGSIEIGRGSWVGEYNNFRVCGGGNIDIGEDCLISQFCTLVGGNHATALGMRISEQGVDPGRLGVTLEDDVWLGAGTTILPGVVVGRGAIIGANSVVNKNVPQYEIWAGSPARRIGSRQQGHSHRNTD